MSLNTIQQGIEKLASIVFGGIVIIALLTLFAGAVKCQDKAETKTTVYAGFINGSYDTPVVNNQGVNGSAQFKLYGYEGVKLEAVGDFSGYFRSHYKVYTYLAGPQVSIDLFKGRLTPFARIMFGATRYDDHTFYAHSIGGGVDVNVTKRFFIRPFQYDKQSSDMNGQPVHRIGAGAGFRF